MADKYRRDGAVDGANGPSGAGGRGDGPAEDARTEGPHTTARAGEEESRIPDETSITPDDIESELANLQRDLSKTNDRYLRLAAEFDNYRKRIERERTDAYSRAQADLARRLLDSVDDLERVADFDESTPTKALLDGVRLVEKKLMQALESAGLEVVDASGEMFDPATMEGIATTEAEHPEEDDVVADVFQRGYRFNGQLLRPARVRVKKFEA